MAESEQSSQDIQQDLEDFQTSMYLLEKKKRRIDAAIMTFHESLSVAKSNIPDAKKSMDEAYLKVQEAKQEVQQSEQKVRETKQQEKEAEQNMQQAFQRWQNAKQEVYKKAYEKAKQVHSNAKQEHKNATEEHKNAIKLHSHEIDLYTEKQQALVKLEAGLVSDNKKLMALAEEKVKICLGSLFLIKSVSRQERWAQLNNLISTNESNTAFSSFKHDRDVFNLFEELTTCIYTQEAEPISSDALHILLQTLSFFNTTRPSHQTESFYSHFIYTILATVCAQLPKTVIAVEEMITGEFVKAQGRFELMIIIGKIKICIVEAKIENIRDGIVQGLAGSEVIAELGNLRQSLCIVTSYKEWLLYKNNDTNITKFVCKLEMERKPNNSLMPTEDSLNNLTGFLHSFLKLTE